MKLTELAIRNEINDLFVKEFMNYLRENDQRKYKLAKKIYTSYYDSNDIEDSILKIKKKLTNLDEKLAVLINLKISN